MQQNQAIEILSLPPGSYSAGEIWADLGCGSGTFTLALARHLGQNSHIYAVDKNRHSLADIPGHFEDTVIEKRAADFIKDEIPLSGLDGILMANSLHYVPDQPAFINEVMQWLKPGSRFLIVEYDTSSSNPWIPYPVGWARLEELFTDAGFSSVRKISEVPSRLNRANLYSAIAKV